jgi:lipoate-protein ligase A
MSVWHLLQFKHLPILDQLRLEEALLRVDQRNWCLINEGSPPAIVMGISGQPDELVHWEHFRQAPVPLIRRFSGGGTVFVDENTDFVTFICNTSFIPISPFPKSILHWTGELYAPLFAPHPFQIRENDYVIGEYKCGGNAQSICRQRWLHHSSFLWDYSVEKMNYLSIPKKIPAYRLQRSHHDFLCRLKDYWSERHIFKKQFLQNLREKCEIKEVFYEEVRDLLNVPHRQATRLVDWAKHC